MSNHVLVAFDGTPQGENAFQAALHLASSMDARLWVCAVIELDNLGKDPETNPTYVDTRETYEITFSRMKSQADSRGVACECTVRVGKPSREVIAEVEERGAHYLVIGCKHGRFSLGRWLFSSTHDDLVRQAPCAVLVVH